MHAAEHPARRCLMVSAALVAALLLLCAPLHAQNQFSMWYFGHHAGLDFRNGAPTALVDGAISQVEGCATICSPSTGDLLFYTDGVTIWNRDHQVMQNGEGLNGNHSSSQSALIVPAPCDSTRYYVFTADQGGYRPEDPVANGIEYAIVDMTANGGLGAVVTRNVVIAPSASEQLTAVVHPNGHDIWVIGHGLHVNEFYTWLVTENGVSTPPRVTTYTGVDKRSNGNADTEIGYLKSSPNGEYLALSTWTLYGIELFRFNRNTGEIYDGQILAEWNDDKNDVEWYGLSFSPDNTKLYAAGRYRIAQFDLSVSDGRSIADTRFAVSREIRENYGMQLGPDGRIYVVSTEFPALEGEPREEVKEATLDVIERPNQLGAACGYVREAVQLGSGRSLAGLPNVFDSYRLIDYSTCVPPEAYFTISDSLLCGDGCIAITDSSRFSPRTWQWSFDGATPSSFQGQSPPEVCYQTPGRYPITLTVERSGMIDTMTRWITISDVPTVELDDEVLSCDGEPIQLAPRISGGEQPLVYSWSPARGLSCTDCHDPVANPDTVITYTLTVRNASGCEVMDSVLVRDYAPPAISAGPNIHHCSPDSSTVLGATIQGGSGPYTYQWSPSTGLSCTDCLNPVASPDSTTVYHLTVTNPGGCTFTDSVEVLVGTRVLDAMMARTLIAAPGDTLRTPLLLLDSLADETVRGIHISLRYDSTMLRMLNADDVAELTRGTLLDGWQMQIAESAPGRFSADFLPPSGQATIDTSGPLLNLELRAYLGAATISEIEYDVEIDGPYCTMVDAQAGRAEVRICGLHQRLIELTNVESALRTIAPNPVSTHATIEFSIGLDGPVKLEVFDARGQLVATLVDEHLDVGHYAYEWDARRYPSGLYICRITSGDWSQTRQILKE